MTDPLIPQKGDFEHPSTPLRVTVRLSLCVTVQLSLSVMVKLSVVEVYFYKYIDIKVRNKKVGKPDPRFRARW